MREIDYLCIGHVCHDLAPDGITLGGTSSYASLLATQLGKKVGILTSFGPDFMFKEIFSTKGIELVNIMANQTTVFENTYTDTIRHQYMLAKARKINIHDISSLWNKTEIIHLCLIADEINYNIIPTLSNKSLIGIALQGALRSIGSDGRVYSSRPDLYKFKGIDVAFLSDEDLIGLDHLETDLLEFIPVIVVTHGSKGASILTKEKKYFFPAFPTDEINATGAGDIFGAAFLIEYSKKRDIKNACIYAHAAASLTVERIGVNRLPTSLEIAVRESAYIERFKNLGARSN